MATIQYLVEESSATEGKDGVEATDIYLVTNLSAPPSAANWVAMQQGGIPRYGDRHPAIPGIYVDSVSVRPESGDPNMFRVTTVARKPVVDDSDQFDPNEIDASDFGILRYFYITTDEQMEVDRDGDQITVTHTYADDDPHGRGGLTVTQGGSVSIKSWQQGFTFTRVESRPPARLQGVYGTRLNRFAWNGYDPGAVMCIGIDGDTQDGGETWTVNYNFLLDVTRKWKKDVIFTDPEEGGKPPPEIEAGVGYKTVDVYALVDFTPLGINLSRLRRGTSSGKVGVSTDGFIKLR